MMIKLLTIIKNFIKKLRKVSLEIILEEGEEFDENNDQYEKDTLGARELKVLLDEDEEWDDEEIEENENTFKAKEV